MARNTGTLAAALAAAIFAAAAAGCRDAPPPRPAPPPPKVTVERPQLRDFEEYEDFNGWTAAVDVVEIRSRVRGHIEKIHFRDGDFVEAGAVLFSLDKRPFEASVDTAIGQRKVYEAQKIAAQKEFARLKELQSKGGASMSQLEKAEADVGSLEASIEAAGREIDRLKLDVEFSRITSPLAGRTGRAMLSEGNLVNAGGSDPVLATVVSVDPIQVYFPVPEKTLLRVREKREKAAPGEINKRMADRNIPFKFGLETDRGFPREGMLDFGDNTIDPETGTILVRGKVANPTGFLMPGTRVRVRVGIGDPGKVMVVPDVALLADMDRRYVLVAGPGNKALRRDVIPGRLLDDGMRIILPGEKAEGALVATDRVIVQGHQRVRIQYPVEPFDVEGKPAQEGGN